MEDTVTKIRVVLQASDPLSLSGLTNCVGSHGGISVVNAEQWADADVAVVAADRWRPDVASALRRPAGTASTPVVLVVDEIEEADIRSAVECRVVAVLPRRAVRPERLLRCITEAASGGGVMPPNLLGELMRCVEQLQRELLTIGAVTGAGLTDREIDVLRLIADGLATAEIASKLCFSERTVKNVIYGATRRLNLRSRSHAVAYAMRAGLI
jgi:DNA-binding NarL/FixJ family response regulator